MANSLPLRIGHRGAAAEAPENTLAAFARALALGVDGLELDVRVTRDGIPVVFHDASLARLTGRRRAVARLALADLRAVRVRDEPVPTLAEVLRLVRRRVVVQIEIKPGVPVAPVVRAVRQARAGGHVILASFSPAVLRAARALAPRLPRMWIRERGTPAGLGPRLAALGVAGVSLDHRAIPSAAFVADLHRRGWRVWCWTVNDPPAMRRLAAWGVDAILSDNPALLIATLSPTNEGRPAALTSP